MVRGFRFGAEELLTEHDLSGFEPLGGLVELDPAGDGFFAVGALEAERQFVFVEVDLRQQDLLPDPELAVDAQVENDVLGRVVVEVVPVLLPVLERLGERDETGGLGEHNSPLFFVRNGSTSQKRTCRGAGSSIFILAIE